MYIFALAAGVLTFIAEGQFSSAMITNILLGLIAGKLLEKKK